MFKVLTIAGSDSCGGAGIQADLRAINSLGGYGASVITAVTSQNTMGIKSIFAIPDDVVASQIDSVLSDIKFDAVKTGMLYSSSLIETVARKIKSAKIKNFVIDPVTVSKGGNALLKKDAVKTLVKMLFPLCKVVTPNIDEAGLLSGMRIRTVDDMKKAARAIRKMGARCVLVKGGHLAGNPVDILYNGRSFEIFEGARVITKNTHGIGCAYSALIASFLAMEFSLEDSIKNAKGVIEKSLINAEDIGKGQSSPDTSSWVADEAMSFEAIRDAEDAFKLLRAKAIGALIPEVQMNIVSAKRNAVSICDVAGFPGRIIATGDTIHKVSQAEFGASRHMARVLLSARKYDKSMLGAINIKYSPAVISACRKAKLDIAEFSRKNEPKKLRVKEGRSLDWGVDSVVSKRGRVPDIIFDKGGEGKEAMVRVFGNSAEEAAQKIVRIKKLLKL